MIREATTGDAARIAEIDVMSCRYAYNGIVSDDCLFKDLSVESRIPSVERWLKEKFFESKGREKGFSEFVVWVLEENRMGRNFYEKNGYHSDGNDKIFKRWNKREIRYIKSGNDCK